MQLGPPRINAAVVHLAGNSCEQTAFFRSAYYVRIKVTDTITTHVARVVLVTEVKLFMAYFFAPIALC